jgi:hypothetical protein
LAIALGDGAAAIDLCRAGLYHPVSSLVRKTGEGRTRGRSLFKVSSLSVRKHVFKKKSPTFSTGICVRKNFGQRRARYPARREDALVRRHFWRTASRSRVALNFEDLNDQAFRSQV